ncbi:MAG: hypothetical protein MMC23_008685 [Stictis urceolatum]|nr:hypothetical protein [Stictis urceolata]
MDTHRDALRPSPEEAARISSLSHSLWSGYVTEAEANAQLPNESVQLGQVLRAVPHYLGQVRRERASIQHIYSTNEAQDIFVAGMSQWSAGECGMEPKVIEHDLLLGIQKPTICTFVEDGRFSVWPGTQEGNDLERRGNKIAVLFFAWAYIIFGTMAGAPGFSS